MISLTLSPKIPFSMLILIELALLLITQETPLTFPINPNSCTTGNLKLNKKLPITDQYDMNASNQRNHSLMLFSIKV